MLNCNAYARYFSQIALVLMGPNHQANLSEQSTWNDLIRWLKTKGFDCPLKVTSQVREGAGRGLFATQYIEPFTLLLKVPRNALINTDTLRSLYPRINLEGIESIASNSKNTVIINGTQLISIHLCLHRPFRDEPSQDPDFGPYISSIPRDFDSHPLTWLVHARQGTQKVYETAFLQCLPPGVSIQLDGLFQRFWEDWGLILRCKNDHPAIFHDHEKLEKLNLDNFLWAWLAVNTRCLHRQVFSRDLPQSNLTLCPIIDFANHTTSSLLPQASPKVISRDMWSNFRQRVTNEDFIFFSSDQPIQEGEEIYLKYGNHANRTLFVEYGFVDRQSNQDLAEVDVSDLVEEILHKKQATETVKTLLHQKGYFGDWCLHFSSGSAQASWRLLVALMLINIQFPDECDPDLFDSMLKPWLDVIMGLADIVSNENEAKVRMDLVQLCKDTLSRSRTGILELYTGCEALGIVVETDMRWVKESIRLLWEEEAYVAQAVLAALSSGSTI